MQLIEQWMVSIGCGACPFVHAETVRIDDNLKRLFGWPKAAAYQAIMRLFKRFDMARNEAVQESVLYPQRLLGNRGCFGLCHAGLQLDQSVSASHLANQSVIAPGHLAWSSLGHWRQLASRCRQQHLDPLFATKTTRSVQGPLDSFAPRHSCGYVKGLMDNLG